MSYGTGSYPWPPQGLQRKIRFSPIQLPFKAPYLVIESMAYWLQDGV